MTTKTLAPTDPELLKAAVSFPYFLFHHVRIRDVQADGTSKIIQFEHWPVHDEIISDLAIYPRLIDLKARQIGWSWLLAAYDAWDMLFQAGFKAGVVSAGELEASEFIAKCRFVLTHLPYSVPLDVDNALLLGIRGSTLMGFPSTAKAGRGFTFNRFIADEAAFHAFAQDAYASYEAATEHGQIVIVSSAGDSEKQVTNDFFETTFNGAPDNGYQARFYPWSVRPGRDEDWYEERKRRLSSKPGQMEREYPSTVQEAFRSMLSLRFSAEAIEYGLAHSPISIQAYTLPEGITPDGLSIYELPRPNMPYLIYTDSAEGVGKDYSVTRIREARTLRLCLEYRENVLEPEYHGAKARKLAVWYNTAYAGWERNKGDRIALAYAGYGRLFRYDDRTPRQKADNQGHDPQPGLPVTEATRDMFITDLAVAIETGAIDNNAVGWGECGRFIMVERVSSTGLKTYRAQAAPSAHDDTVACDWGLVYMSKQPGAQSLRTTGAGKAVAKVWGS